MMESSAKTSSPDHNSFISTAHLLPNSTATYWIAPHHHLAAAGGRPMFCPQSTASFTFNLNKEDGNEEEFIHSNNAETELRGGEGGEIPKQPLFEKPLTPSDVGKLNRLVIPKQHAEKYFPLNGGAADPGESGMLLGFEDDIGKSWRFRYSYWNSSQSYVLTKGWSRFVKEKRLDAGDVVIFARHRADAGRLFIGWRRRNPEDSSSPALPAAAANGGGWNRAFYFGNPHRSQHYQMPSTLPRQQDFNLHTAGSVLQRHQTASPVSGNSKILRLFGVDLECLAADESSEPRSSQTQQQQHPYHEYYSNHHRVVREQDTTFSGGAEDAYQHQG